MAVGPTLANFHYPILARQNGALGSYVNRISASQSRTDLVAGVLGQARGRAGRDGVVVARVAHALPAQLHGEAQRRHAQHAAVVVLARGAHEHFQLPEETQLACGYIALLNYLVIVVRANKCGDKDFYPSTLLYDLVLGS